MKPKNIFEEYDNQVKEVKEVADEVYYKASVDLFNTTELHINHKLAGGVLLVLRKAIQSAAIKQLKKSNEK